MYQADHSERARWKKSRLDQIILSAFKQSKRTWYPELIIVDHLTQVKQEAELRFQGNILNLWAAHESAQLGLSLPEKQWMVVICFLSVLRGDLAVRATLV